MQFRFFYILLFLSMIVGCKSNQDKIYNFSELDKCITNKQYYVDLKKKRIDSIQKFYNSTTNDPFRNYKKCNSLYNEYQSFQYDSAYLYASKMLQIASEIGDYNLIGKAKIALSFSCRSRGVYKEAYDLLYSIDSNRINKDVLTDLYAYKSSLNAELANFFAREPYYSNYLNESFETTKKMLAIANHENIFVISAKIRMYELQNKYKDAIALANRYIQRTNPDTHDYAMLTSDVAGYYLILGDTIKAIPYYIRSAIADLKSSTKETSSIRILAELLYKQGDFKRSHTYIVQAMDDANFYNADQRKMQISTIFPIIEDELFDSVKHQKNNLMLYSVLISCFVIALIFNLLFITKQRKELNHAKNLIEQQNLDLTNKNKELTQTQETIKKQNDELLRINDKLKEVQHIKEAYIGYFFSINSSYLSKSEEYRKLVSRKIRNKQFDELLVINNDFDAQKERENMFKLFDQIFLKMFPDFINQFNMLFKPEDRISLKNDESMPAELRIFALIRLGINESEKIANFLDYSVHTVNNYKTKVKNRSIIPNELFEQAIMKIESFKTDSGEK